MKENVATLVIKDKSPPQPIDGSIVNGKAQPSAWNSGAGGPKLVALEE